MNKKNRLRDSYDFNRVYKKSKRFYNHEFTIVFKKNNIGVSRFGFSISKKVGKANKRNLLKRRLKEIVRLNIESFVESYDFIIIPKPETVNLDYKSLKKSLFHCYGNLKKRTFK